MKLLPFALLSIVIFSIAAVTQVRANDIFPYPIHTKSLPNGLRVVLVPFDSPGIIAYYTIVRIGSRNETEPGLSGFAHFFEHMMFRGTERYSPEEYNRLFKELGSDGNAYTTDDYTCYHTLFGSDGLERVIDAESDRFMNLKYTKSDFQQEAKAVLGEYYKNYSNPFSKLYEKVRDTAFNTHTYKHTTMGFLKDIEDMPNQYEFSLTFYDRFYRPENTIILVVGDIEPGSAFALIKKYHQDWSPANYEQEIPAESPQESFKNAHIDWENITLPYLALTYHVPAFSAKTRDSAAIDILAQLIFGPNSPLYQKLVIRDQSVEYISAYVPDHRDPFLFSVFTRIKEEGRIETVKKEIDDAIKEVQESPVDPKRLADIKSRIKYSFAMSLDTAQSVARHLTHFLQLTGDASTVNEIYMRYDEVTAEDLKRLAARIFLPSNCTEVTLTGVKK